MSQTSSTLNAPSYSRMSTFHNCRAKYYYRYVLGAERAAGQSDAKAHAGKCGHSVLDALYRLGYDPIDRAHNALTKAWGDFTPPEALGWLNDSHMRGILVQYVCRWPEDDDDFKPLRLRPMDVDAGALVGFEGEVDDNGYMILAEQPMVVRLSNGQCVTVVLDLAIRRANDSIWVVDHKFTADYLGGKLTNRYVISHQPRLYVLAMQALLGECDGAIINGVYMGESANKATSKAQRFDRYEYPYTDGQLAETLDWAKHTTRQMQEFEAVVADMPIADALAAYALQNDQAYHANCDYLPLCDVSPALRPQRLGNLYQLKER